MKNISQQKIKQLKANSSLLLYSLVSVDGGCEKTLVKTECECIQLLLISKDL